MGGKACPYSALLNGGYGGKERVTRMGGGQAQGLPLQEGCEGEGKGGVYGRWAGARPAPTGGLRGGGRGWRVWEVGRHKACPYRRLRGEGKGGGWEVGRHKACPYRRVARGKERVACMGGGQAQGLPLQEGCEGEGKGGVYGRWAGARPAPTGGLRGGRKGWRVWEVGRVEACTYRRVARGKERVACMGGGQAQGLPYRRVARGKERVACMGGGQAQGLPLQEGCEGEGKGGVYGRWAGTRPAPTGGLRGGRKEWRVWEVGRHKACPYRRVARGKERVACMGGGQAQGLPLQEGCEREGKGGVYGRWAGARPAPAGAGQGMG